MVRLAVEAGAWLQKRDSESLGYLVGINGDILGALAKVEDSWVADRAVRRYLRTM